MELSNDDDVEVRDWATYALAQANDLDSPAVLNALWARVSDPDPDTRAEAMVGLALRGDARVIDPLVHELQSVGDNAGRILVEAAVEAGQRMDNQRLCEALQRLARLPDKYGYEEDLSEALARCG
jgi:HEAT repeat protein